MTFRKWVFLFGLAALGAIPSMAQDTGELTPIKEPSMGDEFTKWLHEVSCTNTLNVWRVTETFTKLLETADTLHESWGLCGADEQKNLQIELFILLYLDSCSLKLTDGIQPEDLSELRARADSQ